MEEIYLTFNEKIAFSFLGEQLGNHRNMVSCMPNKHNKTCPGSLDLAVAVIKA